MLHLKEILIIALLSVIILGNLFDFVIDFGGGATTLHLLEEAAIIVISVGMILWLLLGIRVQRRELEQLRHDMAVSRQGARVSRALAEARHRLGSAIQEQFEEWGLTDSERQVGLLLLKGLSFKEIAALRDTHEKTVRAQASSIYRKAGVSGRHAFSAWFIEDIL